MKIISGLVYGQVLQRIGKRGASAKLSGGCRGDGPVMATITSGKRPLAGWNKRVVGKAARGKFRAELSGIPAGGPYQLALMCGGESVRVASFFVGDVWVLAGQSNMEGIGLIDGKARPHPLIRAFSMRRVWRLATEPLHILGESPDWCHHEPVQLSLAEGEKKRRDAVKGTGVGIFFAQDMLERSGVPQGLICAAHGGTSMQQWSPERKNLGGQSLYASMLASVHATGQPVAGVLWYQGESDANLADAVHYTARMKELVAATRRDFKLPRLPWIVVQIGRVYGHPSGLGPWNDIQEQERLLPKKIKNLETVAAIDLPMDDGIHIGSDGYPLLAHRMARMADRLAYGNTRELPPPSPKKAVQIGRHEDCIVDVIFDNVVGGLQSVGPAHGFIFITPTGDRNDIIHRIVLKGNTARLHLNSPLPQGSRLTYGCGTSPICNITDARGHAVPMFGPIFQQPIRRSLLPFMTEWKVSDVVTDGSTLAGAPAPDFSKLPAQKRSYSSEGFINEHERWFSKNGLGFFQGRIELAESMTLRVLMGYDGPFRLWLDGKPFFADLEGVNPCLPDKAEKAIALKKGVHDIRVGLDLAHGKTWGFFLRFARKDITPKQRASGDYAKPVYLPAE
jgi:hypothetical protein